MKIDVILDFSDDVKSIFKQFFELTKISVKAGAADTEIKEPVTTPAAAPVVNLPAKTPAKASSKKATPAKAAEPAVDLDLGDIVGSGSDDTVDDLDKMLNEAAAGDQAKGDAPLYTVDRVKEKVKEVILKGKSTVVQDLIKKYGAMGISSLDPLHYNAFMDDLNKI